MPFPTLDAKDYFANPAKYIIPKEKGPQKAKAAYLLKALEYYYRAGFFNTVWPNWIYNSQFNRSYEESYPTTPGNPIVSIAKKLPCDGYRNVLKALGLVAFVDSDAKEVPPDMLWCYNDRYFVLPESLDKLAAVGDLVWKRKDGNPTEEQIEQILKEALATINVSLPPRTTISASKKEAKTASATATLTADHGISAMITSITTGSLGSPVPKASATQAVIARQVQAITPAKATNSVASTRVPTKEYKL